MLPDATTPDVTALFDRRLGQAPGRRHGSSLSRAGDPHVMALRTMFDAIHDTMDEYAALLAERGNQIVADTGAAPLGGVRRGHVKLKSTSDGDQNAAEACAEMVRVADKWLRFVEATALRDAQHRMATGEVSRADSHQKISRAR